jgi:L-fucose mutarotase
MGHGDEILLADAHYPGDTFNKRVLRADGLGIPDLLSAILQLFPLDTYVTTPLTMMAAVSGDELDPEVEQAYRSAMAGAGVDPKVNIERLDRLHFYERSKYCYAIVMTGEMAKYGNIILKKGHANI